MSRTWIGQEQVLDNKDNSGKAKLDPKLQRNINISNGGKKFLPHTGSSSDYKSIVEEERYIARRIDIRKRKQACFFSAIHPMNVPMVTTRVEKNHECLHEKRRSVKKTHFCFDLAASLETVVKRKTIHKATF